MNTIQIVGLLGFILFYGCYFFKMFLQQKKGIKTDQLGKGGKSETTIRTERLLKRSTIAIAFIQFFSIFMKDADMQINISPQYKFVGLGIMALGIFVFFLAIITMRDNWRAGIVLNEEISLVTNGIYRYTRNPAFLGFDLFYVGFSLLFSNWILVAVSFMGLIMMHLQILEEEKYLSAIFGEEYHKYKKCTPRYFLFF